jgi:hypothetical protein
LRYPDTRYFPVLAFWEGCVLMIMNLERRLEGERIGEVMM